VQNYREKNLSCLKSSNQKLYKQVINHRPEEIGTILSTPTGPTLRFHQPGEKFNFLCDENDVLGAVQQNFPMLKKEENLNKTVCILTGMGLGYRPLAALEIRQDMYRMMVIEPSLDIFCTALTYVDLRPLFMSDKVTFFVGDINWQQFGETLIGVPISVNIFFSNYMVQFDWNKTLYTEAVNKARAYATKAISAKGVFDQCGELLFKNRIRNMALFREARNVDVLKGAFRDKPAILVSAGPSLNQSMTNLKQAVGKCIIIAVDSAVVPLLNNGITPDFVTTLDFRYHNADKLLPTMVKNASFSLVATISTSIPTARRLPLNHLFFCFQDNDTQTWLTDVLKVNYFMKPVGTVAALSLSFAQMIGADPIILIGHDFALTSKKSDHVAGAIFKGSWNEKGNCISVKGVDGQMVRTQDFLLEFKQSFEEIMLRYPCNYINATASGAHIAGTTIKKFRNIIENDLLQDISVTNLIASALNKRSSTPLSKFISVANQQLREAKKRLKQVNAILNSNEKVKKFIENKSYHQSEKIKSFSQLPKQIQIQKQKVVKLRTQFNPFLPIEEVAAQMINEARVVQEIEMPDTYLDIVEKDAKIVDLEMRGHQKGLMIFIDEVSILISFLMKEDQLISDLNAKDVFLIPTGLKLAKLYLNAMCPAKATPVLERILSMKKNIEDNAEFGTAKVLMGSIKAQLTDFGAAEKWWKKAIEVDSANAEEICKQRRVLGEYWNQRLDDPQVGPVSWYSAFALTVCREKDFALRIKEKGWEKCVKSFQNWMEDPNKFDIIEHFLDLWKPIRNTTPDWYYWKAQVMATKEDKINALIFLQNNLLTKKNYTKQPEYPSWLKLCARLLMETDQFDQGITRLKQAVALDPEQAVLWEELGDTFFENADFASAAIAYENCFLALPQKVDVLKKFGDCYLKQGYKDAAKEAYQAVLKKDPSNESAHVALEQLE